MLHYLKISADILAVLKYSDIHLSIRCDKFALAVVFPVLPLPFIDSTVDAVELSAAVLAATFPLASVGATIRP